MNLMIGTLWYLWPIGRVKAIHTGGHTIKATNSSRVFQAVQLRAPLQSSYKNKPN